MHTIREAAILSGFVFIFNVATRFLFKPERFIMGFDSGFWLEVSMYVETFILMFGLILFMLYVKRILTNRFTHK